MTETEIQFLEIKGTTTTDSAFKSLIRKIQKAGNEGSYFEVNVPQAQHFKVMIGKSNYGVKVTFPSAVIICLLP